MSWKHHGCVQGAGTRSPWLLALLGASVLLGGCLGGGSGGSGGSGGGETTASEQGDPSAGSPTADAGSGGSDGGGAGGEETAGSGGGEAGGEETTAGGDDADGGDEGADTLVVEWERPREREDGTDLMAAEIDYYELHFGTDSGAYTRSVETTSTSLELDGLDPGTYYFAVEAHDNQGLASDFSNEATASVD